MKIEAEDHLKKGFEKSRNEDFVGAIKDYNKAILYDKGNGEIYFRRAVANFYLENHEAVANDLIAAFELDPKYNQELFWNEVP